jgi:hypothetical protein
VLRFAPGLDFDVKEVLNDRIDRDLHFRRGDVREGWLLAMGYKPVPEEYGPCRPAPVEVRLFDQFGQPQIVTTTVAVEGSRQSRKSSLRPGSDLYERENPPVSMERGVDPDAIVSLGSPPRINAARREKR